MPKRNPTWTRDELILALDLYLHEPAARGSKTHPAVIELSGVLNRLPIHARGSRQVTLLALMEKETIFTGIKGCHL